MGIVPCLASFQGNDGLENNKVVLKMKDSNFYLIQLSYLTRQA